MARLLRSLNKTVWRFPLGPRRYVSLNQSLVYRSFSIDLDILQHLPYDRRFGTSVDAQKRVRKSILSVHEAFKQKDTKLFVNEVYYLSQEIQKTRYWLYDSEKEELAEMVRSIVHTLSETQIAQTIRNLAASGFTMKDRSNIEIDVLRDLIWHYSKHPGMAQTAILFLTSLNKFHYSWKENTSEEKEKDIILRTIWTISKERLTGRQFSEFITAMSGIKVPWTALSEQIQDNLIRKMIELKNNFSSISAVAIVYAFSTIEEMKIKEMSNAFISAFFEVVQECLTIKGDVEIAEHRPKQVFRFHFTRVWSFTILFTGCKCYLRFISSRIHKK
jgi:hypothetical protein